MQVILCETDVSVCMATYNGEKYILAQISSILEQLNEGSELIIVDDCSNDSTVKNIILLDDKRIKLYVNSVNLGHVRTFEKAISHSKMDFIFLSDQDDIWPKGRVISMINQLKVSNGLLVTGNSNFCNSKEEKIDFPVRGVNKSQSANCWRNILGVMKGESSYFGCTMVFSCDLKKMILPFPSYVESHDQWIAFTANIMKKNVHMSDIVLTRRIHDNNVSYRKRGLLKKLKTRFIQLISVLTIVKRKLGNKYVQQ